MATWLSTQLKKLAVPQTTALEQSKQRPSLLFDAKEAATIDRETFYNIGVSGLRDLITVNPNFACFENSLFSFTSKNIERAVQNKETNKNLDKTIKKFFIFLSPYVLIKPAHKVLEWLIYRFSIQDYNKKEFLMLVLPYHETNFFAKCLLLMKFPKNDQWAWLNPLKKAGLHLTKASLYNECVSNPAILKFIGQMVINTVKELGSKADNSASIFSFYCTTVIGALENMDNVSESHLSAILPSLFKGLTCQVSDYTSSCYMIIAQLLRKTNISDKLFNQLVKRISDETQNHLRLEATLLLIILYQIKGDNCTISDKALRNLATATWFCENLSNLASQRYSVMNLLVSILNSALKKVKVDIYRSFVTRIFSEVPLHDNEMAILIRIVINHCPVISETDEDAEESDEQEEAVSDVPILEWYAKFLNSLETRFPNSFDRVIGKINSSDNELVTEQQKLTLQHLMNLMMLKQGSKDNYTIFEKLYHPNENFRLNAIKFLVKNYKHLSVKDKEMFQVAVNNRLFDKVPIVKTILKIPKKYLANLLDENIIDVSIKLITKSIQNSEYIEVVNALIKHICYGDVSKDSKLILALLFFFFPTTEEEVEVALNILPTDFCKNYNFLQNLKNIIKIPISPSNFCEVMYQNILSSDFDTNLIFEIVKNCNLKLPIYKYLSCILITSSLPKKQICFSTGIKALDIINSNIWQANLTLEKKKYKFNIFSCIKSAKEKKLPLEGILKCLEIIIQRFVEFKLEIKWFDLSVSNQSILFFIKILVILIKGCGSTNKCIASSFINLMKMFMENVLPDIKRKITLFANLISIDNEVESPIDPKIQLVIIKLITSLLSTQNKSENFTFLLNSDIFMCATLICLINPIQEIRKASFEIILQLKNQNSTSDMLYLPLIKIISEYEEEIILDAEQLPLILCSISSEETIIERALINLYKNEDDAPLYVKSNLLKLLRFINNSEIFDNAVKLATDILKPTVYTDIRLSPHQCHILSNVILRFNESTASTIKLDSAPWMFISLALQRNTVYLTCDGKNLNPSVLVLDQITKDVFQKLNSEVQKTLMKILISIATICETHDTVSHVYKVVKRIELDVHLILDTLTAMRDVKSTKNVPVRKFRRMTLIPTIDILDMIEWKHGITVLEFIQDKKKLIKGQDLLSVLFDILKKCLDFDEQAAVEYPKQLILSTILHICKKLETDDSVLPKNAFNMELVVQCIRASSNPQTHHHALLVLAYTANLFPQQVLHNIMAIFTFMGSSILRHDDAYSFQIISKIIDTIIPIIIQSNENNENGVMCVLRVFSDVILDIPEHRRITLLKMLLSALGVEEYLWLFLAFVFEAHVVHEDQLKQTRKKSDEFTPKRLHIIVEIVLEYNPSIIINTCIKLLDYLKSLPIEANENSMDVDNTIFDIKKHTAKQFRHYKYVIITSIAQLLKAKDFLYKMVLLKKEENLALESSYKEFLISILTFIKTISKIVDQSASTSQAEYWKIMLHYCYEVMDNINSLLTNEMFLLVIRGLIVHNIPTVIRKAMEVLNKKLQFEPNFFYSNVGDTEVTEPEDLLALIPSLLDIVKSVDKAEVESEEETLIQIALLSLKLLIKTLAAKNPDKFIPVLNYIIDLTKLKVSGNILASLLLCIAELCCKLRAHAISGLVKFMPIVIKVLKSQQNQETPGLLLIAVIITVQKTVESLPLFLSPYLEKLLYQLSILAGKWSNNDDDNDKIKTCIKKLEQIREQIGSVIPSRVLIPIISNTYETLINNNYYSAVGPLMNVLSENVTKLTGTELNNFLPNLSSFFLTALQFRIDYKDSADLDMIRLVEDHIINTLTTLVLKLSETSFRPLYYRLFDWAVRNDSKSEKVITFYRLSSSFAEKLKGLFVLFAGHFITNAASLLDQCNVNKNENLYFSDEIKNILLIESILNTLKLVFTYDGQNFIDKDRFETLMQPIVDQLDNVIGNIKDFENRTDNVVIPCITQFAAATADDALWKQLNYQVLLKTRHNLPTIRIIGLKCLCEVARKIGEDFLSLLPETVPFLAELLEDEDENVENCCKKVVQELETIVGEPLHKYL